MAAARKTRLDTVIEELQEMRDELELQMQLASANVRNEWEDLEHKLEHVRARAKAVGKVGGEAAEDVGEALSLVADELRRGYRRIKGML